MEMKTAIVMGVAACSTAFGGIVNGDFEEAGGGFGDIPSWEGGGGVAPHALFFPALEAPPSNLGATFGFADSGSDADIPFQETMMVFEADTTYRFSSWAYGGGNAQGTIVYELGYFGDADDFVLVASESYDLTGVPGWRPRDGVVYTTGAAGDELGRNIVVRFGSSGLGGGNDVWFDNTSLIPTPGVAAIAGIGALAMVRRRR